MQKTRRFTALRLADAGWEHVVVWECENLEAAARSIEGLVRTRTRSDTALR